MALTPNMGMTLPTPTVTPGPLYATENNQAFNVVDSHDHSPGNGVPIPSVGININGDVPFNGFNATILRSSIYQSQSSPLILPTDVRSIYAVGGDLYWNNGIGQPVQITAGAALNAASIGGIGGDYTTSGASVFYTSADLTYTFWSSSNTTGSIEAGPLTIRNNTLNSFGVTINANATISANYSLVLPASLPPSGISFLTVDSSGNISDTYQLDGVTISAPGNIITVQTTVPNGITATQLAANSVTTPKIMDGAVTRAKLEPLGQVTSGSPGGTALTSSTSYILLAGSTNLSVTITTTGRPVMLMLQSDGSGNEAYIDGASSNATAFFRWFRDSTTDVGSTTTLLNNGGAYNLPISSFMTMDFPSAGSHTYEFQARTLGGQTVGVVNAMVVAYEL